MKENAAWNMLIAMLLALILLSALARPPPVAMMAQRSAYDVYVALWNKLDEVANYILSDYSVPAFMSSAIKYYRITGDIDFFLKHFTKLANLAYDQRTHSFWRISGGTRANVRNQPDLFLMKAFCLYCAYEITGNRTYLEWAKTAVNKIYAAAASIQLFSLFIWSNGTVEYAPDTLYDQLPACCYLRWFGERFGNKTWISLADTIWSKLWSYANPLMPNIIDQFGIVVDAEGIGLYYALPCCLAQLMFDSPKLRSWAQQLINYYAKLMALDPDGQGLMHQNCYYDGTPKAIYARVYGLPHNTNHLRFLCAWSHLTGNKTGLQMAEKLASWVMAHMKAPYGYVYLLNAPDLSVCRTDVRSGYITKFISGLMWLFRLTGNITYAREAIGLLDLLLTMKKPTGGIHARWDAQTGEILSTATDWLLDPLNEWFYCISTMPHGKAKCLTPANFQYKFILPHFGNFSLNDQELDVIYYVPLGVVNASVSAPFTICAMTLNGTEWWSFNESGFLLPPGTWVVHIKWINKPADSGAEEGRTPSYCFFSPINAIIMAVLVVIIAIYVLLKRRG